jgi:hypothetical protein
MERREGGREGGREDGGEGLRLGVRALKSCVVYGARTEGGREGGREGGASGSGRGAKRVMRVRMKVRLLSWREGRREASLEEEVAPAQARVTQSPRKRGRKRRRGEGVRRLSSSSSWRGSAGGDVPEGGGEGGGEGEGGLWRWEVGRMKVRAASMRS